MTHKDPSPSLEEAVARGLYAHYLTVFRGGGWLDPMDWDECEEGWKAYAAMALLAIEGEGWCVVPREPTEAMVRAGFYEANAENAAGVWRDMLKAQDGGGHK